MNKLLLRIALPAVVVLCAVIGLAQVTNGKKQTGAAAAASALDSETDTDRRRKTGDDPWSELSRVYENFARNQSFTYSGNMKLTDEEGSETIENATFSGETANGNFRYVIDSTEFIYSPELSLNVYPSEKLIVAGTEKQSVSAMWQAANIDSVKSFAGRNGATVEALWEDGHKVIKISNTANGDVYGYEIHYNPVDYKLTKVVMHFATLDDLGEDATVGEEANLRQTATEMDTVPAATDSLATGPAIEFNLYRLEMVYNRLASGELKSDFDPVKRIGNLQKQGFRLNDAYRDYRLVWIDRPKGKR